MTAAMVIAEAQAVGIRITADGDRLHVEGPRERITPALRAMLAEHKADILAAIRIEHLRAHLLELADGENIERVLVDHLDDGDVLACADLDDDTLRAYIRRLDDARIMARGLVPWRWGGEQTAICAACGPVSLWPGAPERVTACPWCHHRVRGVEPARPVVACADCQHYIPDELNPVGGMGRCAAGVAGLHWPHAPIRCARWQP